MHGAVRLNDAHAAVIERCDLGAKSIAVAVIIVFVVFAAVDLSARAAALGIHRRAVRVRLMCRSMLRISSSQRVRPSAAAACVCGASEGVMSTRRPAAL
jgi:hypothetical protein